MNTHSSKNFEFVRKDLAEYGGESNIKLNETVKQMIKEGVKVHHLAFGQSPFPVPEKLSAELQKYAHITDYLPVQGIAELREAICHHHKSIPTGIPESLLHPDNIIVSDGSKILFYLVMAVTDSVVILKAPTWPTYMAQLRFAGNKLIIAGCSFEDNWKLTPDSLSKSIEESGDVDRNKILIFTNTGNPSGLLYTEEELVELTKVFRKYNIVVISDEIYSHLTFSGQKYVSLSKFYPEGTIITTGMSKWASAGGWRVGYGIFPPELSSIQKAVFGGGSDTYSCGSAPQQYAVTEYLNDVESCKEYIFHTTRILENINNVWVRKLREVGVKIHSAGGGYCLHPDFSDIRTQMAARSIHTGQQMVDALFAEANLVVQAGAIRHLEKEDALTLRLCFVNFDGKKALAASRALGMEKNIGEEFVYEHCKPTVDAADAMAAWYKKTKESK